MMRPSYTPELSAGNHLAGNLVEDFQQAGHEVELITPVSDKFDGCLPAGYTDNCTVHRVQSRYRGRNVTKRILKYIDTSLAMYRAAKNIECDIIISHSMPPLLGPLSCRLARKKKKPLVYWEQDIVSQSIISTGISGSHSIREKLMFHIALMLEKYTEKHCDHIITITKKFAQQHIKRGVPESKISVVYNWIDVNSVFPKPRTENPLFDELGLNRDDFLVTYCGNLGLPQNVEILVDAAKRFETTQGIRFVIIGSGAREKDISNYISDSKCTNIVMHPLYPLERACDVYNIGDVGLVIGKKGTSSNGFPSKTWSILAAGQAMISCFDLGSELSDSVLEGNAGIAVEPDNPDALFSAVNELFTNREKCREYAQNARAYAVNNCGRENATKRYIEIVSKVLKESR